MSKIEKPEFAIKEIIEKRTLNSKTFIMPNGKQKLIRTSKSVSYLDENGQYQDIDTKIIFDNLKSTYIAKELPFIFELNKTGVGFSYRSRKSGYLEVVLSKIDEDELDQFKVYDFNVKDSKVTFENIKEDLDIVFEVTAKGVKTFRILKSEKAPRIFHWKIKHDEHSLNKISNKVVGFDSINEVENRIRRPCDIKVEKTILSENEFILKDEWSGLVKDRDLVNRVPFFNSNPVYPVIIDPDITEEIGSDADDGLEFGTSWYNNFGNLVYFGRGSFYQYHSGFRFQTVAVPNGATIDLANLKINVTGKVTNYGAGKIYGSDTDDSSAWSSSNRPTQQTKTTASTTVSRPTSTGIKTYDVTSIVQEIVDRAGWVSGNDMSLFILNNEGSSVFVTKAEDFSHAGTNEAVLEIDYTEATSDLSINVNDSVTLSEFTQQNFTNYINVNDSISVAEVVNVNQVFNSTVNDSISLTELQTVYTEFNININESITISEFLIVENLNLNINVLDSISLSEFIDLDVSDVTNLYISDIFESITVTENISCINEYLGPININDTISLVESVLFLVDCNINVNDAINSAENINVTKVLNISVNDSISLVENFNLLNILTIFSVDSISIAESLIVENLTLNLSVSDNISISEYSSVNSNEEGILSVSVNDNVNLIEFNVTENLNLGFSSVIDSISLSEFIDIENELSININDSITLSEYNNFEFTNYISVIDNSSISELVSSHVDFNVNKNDTINLSENINIYSDINFSISDIIVTEENSIVANINLGNLVVSDIITLNENTLVDIPGTERSIFSYDSVSLSDLATIEKEIVSIYVKKINSKITKTIKINSKL